jgi:hypothetical protein
MISEENMSNFVVYFIFKKKKFQKGKIFLSNHKASGLEM